MQFCFHQLYFVGCLCQLAPWNKCVCQTSLFFHDKKTLDRNCWTQDGNCWTQYRNCWTQDRNCLRQGPNCWAQDRNCWSSTATTHWLVTCDRGTVGRKGEPWWWWWKNKSQDFVVTCNLTTVYTYGTLNPMLVRKLLVAYIMKIGSLRWLNTKH